MPATEPSRSGLPPRQLKRGAKIAEKVAHAIVHDIVSKQLPAGTQLPSEANMLEEFGVGRGSLREALRILEIHGIITLKPGPNGGPSVVKAEVADFGRMASLFFHLNGATINQLLAARLVLEPLMVRLAAEQRAQELSGRLADPSHTDVLNDQVYFDATKDFHQAVASMSDNPVLNLISASLEAVFRDQISGLLSPIDERKHVLEVHSTIERAISEGKATRAERLMHEHMQQYADWARKQHPHLLDQVIDWG